MNFRQERNPRSQRPRRGLYKAALIILLFAAGAAYPHWAALKLPGPSGDFRADVIFVFTGGEHRIPEGFRAWKEGKGKELFVLGAKGGTKLERILPDKGTLGPEDLRRIHVEGWSENTMENAFSAKSVMAERNFRQAILVTSDYHMPRAHFALRSVLPHDVVLAVLPVRSEWRKQSAFPRTLRHFFVEGWKYWGYRLFFWTV